MPIITFRAYVYSTTSIDKAVTQPSTRTDTAQGDGLRQLRLQAVHHLLPLPRPDRSWQGCSIDIACEIVSLSTTGDEVLDRPLVEVGGKGVFIKTLEAALLDGQGRYGGAFCQGYGSCICRRHRLPPLWHAKICVMRW